MPRVLIVDDEPGIRFALKRWFERQRWQVDEAQDGQSALDCIAGAMAAGADGGPFDLIVTDLHLPHVTGEELVQRLRDTIPALATRVILTTGDSIHDAPAASVLATHPYVLEKPFDLGALRAMVDRVLA